MVTTPSLPSWWTNQIVWDSDKVTIQNIPAEYEGSFILSVKGTLDISQFPDGGSLEYEIDWDFC